VKWPRETVVREPPFREDFNPDSAIVRSPYQATTSEDIAEISDGAIINCN
jgi:hypothetical protein